MNNTKNRFEVSLPWQMSYFFPSFLSLNLRFRSECFVSFGPKCSALLPFFSHNYKKKIPRWFSFFLLSFFRPWWQDEGICWKKRLFCSIKKVTIIHNNFKKFYGATTFKEPLQLVINYQHAGFFFWHQCFVKRSNTFYSHFRQF